METCLQLLPPGYSSSVPGTELGELCVMWPFQGPEMAHGSACDGMARAKTPKVQAGRGVNGAAPRE